MPINSPTGFLDITNATLRTSNLEAQNLLITGGNIYVTSELEADATVLNLENVTRKGNVSSNTIEITNVTTGIVATGNVHALKFIGSGSHLTDIPSSAISGTLSQWSDGANSDVYIASNVGIGNVHTLTSNTLQVGGNLYVRDTDANVLTVNGNVVASYFEGDGSKLSGIVTDLQGVTDNGNVTTNVVQFSNVTTGLVTTANIEVGGDIKVVGLSAGTVPYVASDKFLKDSFITMTGDATVITSNLDVTGNIFMRGEKFIVESETKLINDAIIGIANNNTVSTTDKGIIMQNTTGNVAIIHHGTGDGFADQLTFGYTADPLDTVTVTNDLTKELTVNVLGNVITQNNLSIGGLLKINTISAASSHSLQAVTNLGNVTSNTVQFSNAITSLVASSNIVATGNVSAGRDTDTTSYFGRAAVGYMGTSDQASFAHFDRNSSAQYALKQTAVGATTINTPATQHIRFTVNDGNAGAEKMRITSAGNVGIGVSAPHANLHVEGNVYVSSNLTVSGNVSDLNVVSNVNMLQTANTAAIKLNSNVVAEFPRSKKLIKYPRVALTSASQDGYTVDKSNDNGTNSAYYLFDNQEPNNASSRWRTAGSRYTNSGSTPPSVNLFTGSETGDWVSIEFPEKMKLAYYTITGLHEMSPKEGVIYGYDGSTWHKVSEFYYNLSDSIVNVSPPPYFSPKFYAYEGIGVYSKYAMVVSKTNGHSDSLSFYEWKLYGVPEYDSGAHGTDVVFKSITNDPNNDSLEVYFDAKNLSTGSLSTTAGAITGLGGTSINGTAYGNPQVSDGAFVFDGSGDWIQSGATSLSGNAHLTIACWVKIAVGASNSAGTIFSLGANGTSQGSLGFRTLKTGDGNLGGLTGTDRGGKPGDFRYFTVGGTGDRSTEIPADEDVWHHIVLIHDGPGGFKLYMNGVYKSSTPEDNLNLLTNCTLTVGNQVSSGSTPIADGAFNGSIANIRLFKRPLSTDEIWQLYAYQKEDFGHGKLDMILKNGRLGIGTSEPKAPLDVMGELYGPGSRPGFSIHTSDYWSVDGLSWGTDAGTHYSCPYFTPLPFIEPSWLEYDSHNTISFEPRNFGSNAGHVVRFTAPKSGFYHFSFVIGLKGASANDYIGFMLNKNRGDQSAGVSNANDYFLGTMNDYPTTARIFTLTSTVNIYMKQGEYVVPYSRSVNHSYIGNGGAFHFSGFYIG